MVGNIKKYLRPTNRNTGKRAPAEQAVAGVQKEIEEIKALIKENAAKVELMGRSSNIDTIKESIERLFRESLSEMTGTLLKNIAVETRNVGTEEHPVFVPDKIMMDLDVTKTVINAKTEETTASSVESAAEALRKVRKKKE